MQNAPDDMLKAISARAFMDEAEAVSALMPYVEKLAALETPIMARAATWTKEIRGHAASHGVETFLHTYGLDTDEGVALMCLAEALLRIPDALTADALIRDTFEGRHWERFTGGDSWMMNMSSWGLLLTGRVLDFGHDAQHGVLKVLKNLLTKMGEPVIREALKKAMTLLGGQFVLGETVNEALHNSQSYIKRGYRFSYDVLGEGARSDAQAQAYVQSYREGIAQIGKTVTPGTALFDAPGISVKLSALHPRYRLAQRERMMAELLPRLKEIVAIAKHAGITIAIDAEESSRLDIELLLFGQLLADPEFSGWNGIGFVVQAYQKRAPYVIDWLAGQAQKYGRVIPLRLVKGAYWDSEIKWTQMAGLPGYPVFTRKEYTDVSMLACADKMLSQHGVFYPQFATHNARTLSTVVELAEHYGWARGEYEFQRLHGMGEALHNLVVADYPSRIYAPVGQHKDLLAYLIRRLLENGSSSSFVHLLMDEHKSAEDILADPVAVARAYNGQPHPAIPLPRDMYGPVRKNSAGMDFGNLAQLEELLAGLPTVDVMTVTENKLPPMIETARKAFPGWSQTTVNARAIILERAADLLEKHCAELVALCAQEGGKTLADGIAEVREAADFCRYYAAQARNIFSPHLLSGPVGESNILSLHPRGVFACISPWNFPLAIFMGQVVAALVTGNCVIAKPAEQTPHIAQRAVALLHEAGIPRDILHLAIGSGETVGAALVADRRIDGVVFTGGTDTAQHIAKSLAARGGPIVPFIAETGGQNCMVVDSSALIEQVVDDIIISAFGSAGQRCSALRVLFVQEDIAEELLALLAGAMQELKLGDPHDPATDIGPVIDAEAQSTLLAYIEKMKGAARLIASIPPSNLPGYFVPPHAFEITHIGELAGEVFGPILHVVRFKVGALPQVADAVNSTNYGLTFGIHSRIDEHVQLLISHVRAGNIYVNRSMIGAVVGVQPFGGENLSGTGPKAGGPHYLLRFLTERTVTVNTAAVGGNVALLK